MLPLSLCEELCKSWSYPGYLLQCDTVTFVMLPQAMASGLSTWTLKMLTAQSPSGLPWNEELNIAKHITLVYFSKFKLMIV